MQGFNRSFSSKLSIMYTSAQKTREPSFKPWAKTAKTACFSRETKCILLPLDLLFLVCFSNVSSPWNGAGEMPEKKKNAFYISSNCKDHGSAAWYSVQPVIPLKSTQSVWLDTVLRQKHILKVRRRKTFISRFLCNIKKSSFRSLRCISLCIDEEKKSAILFLHLKAKQGKINSLAERLDIHWMNFLLFPPQFIQSVVQRIKSAIIFWPWSSQTQPSSVFSWLLWPCQVLLQSGSLSSRVEVDMIAFKQPLLASDTQLQPGTSSDSKSTMMDCLAKTADQRRSKFRCVSGCRRHVKLQEMAFPIKISKHEHEFLFN